MARKSYKGVDDFDKSISIGDGYINDAYDDVECKFKPSRHNLKEVFFI